MDFDKSRDSEFGVLAISTKHEFRIFPFYVFRNNLKIQNFEFYRFRQISKFGISRFIASDKSRNPLF
jgi:hypothetical protein